MTDANKNIFDGWVGRSLLHSIPTVIVLIVWGSTLSTRVSVLESQRISPEIITHLSDTLTRIDEHLKAVDEAISKYDISISKLEEEIHK